MTGSEPADEQTKTNNDGKGYMHLLARGGIGVAIILLADFLTTWIFNATYSHDETTAALIPFQNSYLARTDAFITSEGVITEFTTDPGPTARFVAGCITPFISIMVLAGILYLIPFTRKLVDFTWQAIVFSLFILMLDSLFSPPVMTVFDRENKVMIVYRPQWIFFGSKTRIPFDQISGFTFEIEEADSDTNFDDVQYADLFATTSSGKVFIGENQVGAHPETTEKVPIVQARRVEIERALDTLKRLIDR